MSDHAIHSASPPSLARVAEMEADLAAIRLELEHTQRLTTVGTIAAGVAHEVNNILTPALAYAQMAIDRTEDTELTRKALEKARIGIEAASRILQAILDFSSSTSDIDEDQPAVADVDRVFQAALDCLGRDLASDGISLVRRIPRGTRVDIRPLALQQTFLNLLLNAGRALRDRRGGRITVSARLLPDDTTEITVADDGPGIDPAIADSLIEPFVSSRDREHRDAGAAAWRGGSGLGLAICRKVLDSSGGSIEARATDGGGATFVLRLRSIRDRV